MYVYVIIVALFTIEKKNFHKFVQQPKTNSTELFIIKIQIVLCYYYMVLLKTNFYNGFKAKWKNYS